MRTARATRVAPPPRRAGSARRATRETQTRAKGRAPPHRSGHSSRISIATRAYERDRDDDAYANAQRDVFDDRALVRAPARRRRGREGERDGRRGAFGDFKTPRTPTEAMRALLSPFGAFVVAAIVSVANPTFMTSGREAILMKLYERQSGGETSAYVKDGVLYRMDASGSMTANAKDGIMVDKNGGIWVIVPQKDDVTLIKQKYYMGQIEDVPTLPKNPSAAEQKKYDEFMAKLFDFEKLPNVKKVYDGPYPVPVRKETEKFFREGLPASVMDEIEGVGALFEQR